MPLLGKTATVTTTASSSSRVSTVNSSQPAPLTSIPLSPPKLAPDQPCTVAMPPLVRCVPAVSSLPQQSSNSGVDVDNATTVTTGKYG